MSTDIIGEGDDAVKEQPGLIAHVQQVVGVVGGNFIDLNHLLNHERNHHGQPRTEDVVAIVETGLPVVEVTTNVSIEYLIGQLLGVCCRDLSDIGAV